MPFGPDTLNALNAKSYPASYLGTAPVIWFVAYTFELRKGGLGFWQVNMTLVYNDQRAIYE